MMLLLKLALRNIRAHAQRSIIMFTAVALVSTVVFLFMAFSDGEMENFRQVMKIWDPSPDIMVSTKGFYAASDSSDDWEAQAALSLKDWKSLLAPIAAIPGVEAAWPRSSLLDLDLQARGKNYSGFYLRLMDPAHDTQGRGMVEMRAGDFIADSAEPQIMLHYKSRSSLPVQPGDTVTLRGKDFFGQMVSQEVKIAGFFCPEMDNPNFTGLGYLNPAAFELVSGFNPGEILRIDVKTKAGESLARVITNLEDWNRKAGLGLEFTNLREKQSDNLNIYLMLRFIFVFVSVLLVFIVSFGVMSVVSTNLYDRKREIGTYYCLGTERGFLVGLYTLEIMIINMAATFAGIGLGFGVRELVNSLGIRTDDSGLQLVFGGSRFTLGMNGDSVVLIVGMMLVVSLVTALTTLGKRLKVSPVAALRETE